MPKKKPPAKPRQLYKSPPPKPERGLSQAGAATNAPPCSKHHATANALRVETTRAPEDFPHALPLAPSHFELHDDDTIALERGCVGDPPQHSPPAAADPAGAAAPRLILSSDSPFLRLYQGNCLELLDAIYARHGNAGCFDAIFADPPT